MGGPHVLEASIPQVGQCGLLKCSAGSPAVFCRSTEQSFLRLATNASILRKYECEALGNAAVIGILEKFCGSPAIDFVEEPSATRDLWLDLAARPTASPKLWMDAYLAAFAISAEMTFVTFDQGFRQFEPAGLRLELLS